MIKRPRQKFTRVLKPKNKISPEEGVDAAGIGKVLTEERK